MYHIYSAAPLQTSPTFGNQLGGAPIFLAGPCFNPNDTISCVFEGSKTAGSFISMVQAVCMSPFFEEIGWMDLRVTIERADGTIYIGDAQFYAGKIRIPN